MATWAGSAGLLDTEGFREVMGRFPTGVTVVAALRGDGTPSGLTVNSFTSVSLDPPLVMVCISRQARTLPVLLEAGRFAVSILASDQEPIAHSFAFAEPATRFGAVEWQPSPGGCPVLTGAAAWLDCEIVEVISAGDHSILLGRVDGSGSSGRDPLVFHGGSYWSADA